MSFIDYKLRITIDGRVCFSNEPESGVGDGVILSDKVIDDYDSINCTESLNLVSDQKFIIETRISHLGLFKGVLIINLSDRAFLLNDKLYLKSGGSDFNGVPASYVIDLKNKLGYMIFTDVLESLSECDGEIKKEGKITIKNFN